jgi:hypothetical protein
VLPLTGALCTAIASQLPDSVAYRHTGPRRPGTPIRLGSPSGVLEVDASVSTTGGTPHADFATVYRTTRRLFTGFVHT